ncbi:hypothetical protein DCS_04973 [Drechmeria coniospora]|uniref:Uncharacterized protein n=1 Tax=Drechmeria coniospora TaxID=98403 RepID=A0A151GLI5_DRECN|nr:hypothetical protein DCS_04973 [Drechmeria coniospora]KYK57960.1 hypothetical protein DCS_04973 [Drechmeria coniospora]
MPQQPAPTAASAASSLPVSEDDVDKIAIASLTLDTQLIPLRKARRVPVEPFPFLHLPSELRVKVYEYYFASIDPVLDLGPDNYKRIHKRLGLMRTCKQVHAEASHLFYSSRTFRIFPTHPGRYFKSKKPLLARLHASQRRLVTSLELRLGPGWNAPPKGWVVNDALGLQDCIALRTLRVFVECDPSDAAIKGWVRSDGFYETFCCTLLANVLDGLPAVDAVEFDAWKSVKKSGNMMRGLLDVVSRANLVLRWGPERGWTEADEPAGTAVVFAVDDIPIQGYSSNMLVVA